MIFREVPLTETVLEQLIALSRDWAAENSCAGYRANSREDIEGNRIFVALDDEETDTGRSPADQAEMADDGREIPAIVGYLFGHVFRSEQMRSVMPDHTACFEIEELYVIPTRRSEGIGAALFSFASEVLRPEAEYVVLSTATKNWRAILHFYLEELGMSFWSARLYKKLDGNAMPVRINS